MEDKKGAKERLDAFTDFLRREERSKSTVEKYSREISLFLQWLDGRSIARGCTDPCFQLPGKPCPPALRAGPLAQSAS